ncbi:GntR family transcriptional regulator [Gemelliphila palaticanis]|uniref:GntR family transcriptional regulator n=1 Tax=Gemelliphila palaticanis TaxID=81950 RepID=A0ABX2SZC2_9BACL|nr:GntR family transcriptional regulator [Gemella palaticanis]MBF0715787.1 GntR family transcriptional regulator [Gemella palaticanis]NYS47717.1 GntR family transcriptional regulator [Gemella palaticanis]
MFEVDIRSKKSLYQQIVDNVKDLLVRNILRENDKLPSVREMASILQVNISTVQKAYQILESEKIINTVVGKGTFITNNLDEIKPNYDLIDRLINDLIREARMLGINKKELLSKIDSLF